MPVNKLRSLDQAETSLWRDPRDPRLWKEIASLWSLSSQLASVHFAPGVHKHRNVTEAQDFLTRTTQYHARYHR